MAKGEKTQVTKKESQISLKDSIKTKLIAIMAAVAAVPLIIAIIISYNTSTSKAKSDALDLLAAQAKSVEGMFASVIEENITSLQAVACAPSTESYLSTYGTAGQTIPDEVMLNSLDLLNDNINDGNKNCILSLPSGKQLLRTDRKELADISDRKYFQDCIATGQPQVSEIVVSKSAGNRIMIMIVPIFSTEGHQIIGTLQRSYDLNNLHNFLAENVSDGYITDAAGMMAAHAQFEISAEDEPYDLSSFDFVSSTEASGISTAEFSGNLTYMSWVKEPVSKYNVVVSKQEKEIMEPARRSAMTVVVIGIILVIIAVVLSVIMAKSFTDPVQAVSESLIALADGRFVQVEKHHARKDEFGAISKATNSVITKLDDIVTNIKMSAGDVGKSSEELSDMADQISRTAEDVANAVQEIASGATQQADEIQDATENVGKIGEAVGEVQGSAETLTSLAGKMKEASEVSGKSLSELQDSSNEMTAKIDEISKTIQETQAAVDNISEKVEGITSIATQTNLLSLNASIEAARAGEAGKGFAVVAEEIGKLADDSKAMADEIRGVMDALLQQAKAAVGAAEEVRQGNNEQQLALGETLNAVNGMLDDISSTVEGVKQISQGAETCESSKEAVVDTMSALSAISEENAASSEETGASMQELSATVTTLAGSANDLKKIAEKLNRDMEFFKD